MMHGPINVKRNYIMSHQHGTGEYTLKECVIRALKD
jgi:hypothetical protein